MRNEFDVYSPNGNAPKAVMRAHVARMEPTPDRFMFDDDVLPGMVWVNDFKDWHLKRASLSHPGYSLGVALWLLSTVALGRVRIHTYEEMNTMLYILMVGPSTIFAKTTAATKAMDVMTAIDPALAKYIYLTANATPQSMVNVMTSKVVPENWEKLNEEDRERVIWKLAWSETRSKFFSEAGGVLQKMAAHGGGSEYHVLLRQLYDGNGSFGQETIARGNETADNAYAAVMFDLTYADIKKHASPRSPLWQDGFWARYLFMGSKSTDPLPTGRNQSIDIPASVLQPLAEWHDRLGKPHAQVRQQLARGKQNEVLGHKVHKIKAPGHDVSVTGEAGDMLADYHDWCRQQAFNFRNAMLSDLMSNYGRMAAQATKIGALFASMAGHDDMHPEDAALGIKIAEQFRLNLHTVYEEVQGTQTEVTEDEVLHRKILSKLYERGEMTARELRQQTNAKTSLAQAITDLEREGMVTGKKEGRKVVYEITLEGRDLV